MQYVLFVGTRIGYEALNTLIKQNLNIQAVFIEEEHAHENVKYFHKINDICKSKDIFCSSKLNSQFILEYLDSNVPDIIMSFGYRRFISSEIYQIAKECSIGSHFAPLPKYRGFAPVNWAIINGETETAVSLFHLGEGIDDGDIIAKVPVPINLEDDINAVMERCINSFKQILSEEINNFERGIIKKVSQNHKEATYTCARSPEDGYIDWSLKTIDIYNLVRGTTHPFPGAFTYLGDKKLTIWRCEPVSIGNYVGRISGKIVKIIKDRGVYVLTGDGAVLISDIECEGSGRVTADKIIKSIRNRLK